MLEQASVSNSKYFRALCEAMTLCAEHPKAIFLGQAVASEGTAMYHTLKHLPSEKRLELPVAENMQLGMSTGLALQGHLPISIFPRINFLLEAISQLVQHLDKIPLYSNYRPKVLIRTAIATPYPLDPGSQHLGDYTDPLIAMLKTVRVRRLETPEDVMVSYKEALEFNGSTLLVEYTRLYE